MIDDLLHQVVAAGAVEAAALEVKLREHTAACDRCYLATPDPGLGWVRCRFGQQLEARVRSWQRVIRGARDLVRDPSPGWPEARWAVRPVEADT